MAYKYIIIHPDGKLVCETHEKLPHWKGIQKYVEGPFQIVPYFSSLTFDGKKYNRGTAYCNEEGKLKGMAPNMLASAAWLKACPQGDPRRMSIAGPLLFIAKEKPDAKAS